MKLFESKGVRAILILGLIAVLSIMLLIVGNLVSERQKRQASTQQEISDQWSRAQQIYGPYVKVMCTMKHSEDGKIKTYKNALYFSPEELQISGNINPQKRKRGIYEVMLYDTDLKVSGSFGKFTIDNDQIVEIDWPSAELTFGISDMRGLNDNVNITIGGQQVRLESSVEPKFLKAKLTNLNPASDKLPFNFNVNFRGSEHLQFIPTSANTAVNLTSSWSSPSFYGAFLPISHEVNGKGFSAKWKVLEMNRNLAQVSFTPNTAAENPYQFGVKLVQPNDNYQKNERAVKYGILIISLTFLGFFFSEILLNKHVHIIQYGLVGLALIVFYCLLLSFSEIISFNPAYLLSSVMTIGLIYMFCRGVFLTAKPPLIISLITASAYGFIFVVIQLEDTALLVGSIGLFIILAITMWISRNINWETKEVAE